MDSVLKRSINKPTWYYIKEELDGYTTEERDDLARELEQAGFKYHEAQMGGGAGEVVQQIIASINLNDALGDIFLGIAVNRIDAAITAVWNWKQKHKKKPRKAVKQFIEVFIYTPLRGRANCYYIQFETDKKYTKKEVEEALKKMCEAPRKWGDSAAHSEVPLGQATITLGGTWLRKDTPISLHTFEYIVRGALLNWWTSLVPAVLK
jgi:hypothetical protein